MPVLTLRIVLLLLLGLFVAPSLTPLLADDAVSAGEVWPRHTIDASSRGADGVRVADVNGDGLPDLTTGWEEGGQVRVYVHPGAEKAKSNWPAVTVGRVRSPEDAVFADLNGDGAVDVVSCCEGRTKTMFVHWAPRKARDYLNDEKWRTEAIPCTEAKQAWMFATPIKLPDVPGPALVVGSKGGGASVGLLLAGANPEDVDAYRYVELTAAGWIMSLHLDDVDGDGDQDVVLSDRKGRERAVWWLANPGQGAADPTKWKKHLIGAKGMEVMFLDVADLNQDSVLEVVTATRNQVIVVNRKKSSDPLSWSQEQIPNPFKTPNGKAVRVADMNGDGRPDLVHSANNGGKRQHEGVVWMERTASGWKTHRISGPRGVKFDLLQLLDVDRDGDLDVVTCEERDNLGVFWYENRLRD